MKKNCVGSPRKGWSGEITSTVCVCVLFLSQREMVGDDGFSVGREDGVRFSTPTSIWSRGQNSQGRCFVTTLDIFTPTPVNVCEDLHDDEVIWVTDGGIGTSTTQAWMAMMRQKRV